MIKNVAEYVVKQLVEFPESVSLNVEEEHPKITVTVTVASTDLKRVIGREGRVVRAIQALIGALYPEQEINVVVNSAQ